jgi:hypothetical protein
MTSLLENDNEYYILDMDDDLENNQVDQENNDIIIRYKKLFLWIASLFSFIAYTRLLCLTDIFNNCKEYTPLNTYNSFSEIFTRGTILFFISRINNTEIYKKKYYYITVASMIIIWELLDKIFPDLYIRSNHIPTKYMVLLVSMSIVIFFLYIYHLWLAYKLHKMYVYIYILTVIGMFIYYIVFYFNLEKYYDIYIHHYFIFGTLALLPQFDNILSKMCLCLCIGIWIHGIGVYGAGYVI